jgi:hypothetical protein
MSDFFKFEYIDPKNIILNNNNEDYGTFIQGTKSGIEISTFQQPTHLTFKSNFIGGFVQDVISFRGNAKNLIDSSGNLTGYSYMFSPSINDEISGDFPSDSIIIYQTGQGFGNVSSKGPYLRLGYHNIISEVPDSRLGIGTLFPAEKVHISGGNLRVDGGASFSTRPTVNGTGILLSGEAYPSNNPSGFITGVDLSNYATNSNLSSTGANLDNKINLLSGYVEEENVLVFNAELPSGQESVFLTYPFSLDTSPSSITCSFQNTIDNVIYTYTLGQITQSGFYANFSDILSSSGYLLKVKVKK